MSTSMSGVGVDDSVVNRHESLKKKDRIPAEGNKRYKAISFKFSPDLKNIICDDSIKVHYDDNMPSHPADSSSVNYDVERTYFRMLCEQLPPAECRYIVYDLYYNEKAGAGIRNKIVLIAWGPDNAPIKDKMLFASTKDSLKKKLTGIADECQASDEDDLDLKIIVEKGSQGKGVYDQ